MTKLFTATQIRAQMASWVCRQHPFHSVAGVDEVNALITADSHSDEWFGPSDCRMRRFEDWRAVEKWLRSVVDGHPQLQLWNEPKSGHANTLVFSSRYGGPRPEDDFIDIDALLRNVALYSWRESEADAEQDTRIDDAIAVEG